MMPASVGLREAKLVMNFQLSVSQPCQKIEMSSTASTSIATLVATRQVTRNARLASRRDAAERGADISRTPRGTGAGCTGRSW
jgi:hypothetical protein